MIHLEVTKVDYRFDIICHRFNMSAVVKPPFEIHTLVTYYIVISEAKLGQLPYF